MTNDHSSTRPPAWAEALLRLLLKPEDRENVSGDLLEEYRRSIVPSRGKGADVWYVRQVAGFLWRSTWMWALMFSGVFLARTIYDWRVPTTDFAMRSAVTTWSSIAVLFIVALGAAWRSGAFAAGPLAAVVTSQIAALISVGGAALLFAVWHDPATMSAINGSGGLGEAFFLPFVMIVPALIVGSFGGALGRVAHRLLLTQ